MLQIYTLYNPTQKLSVSIREFGGAHEMGELCVMLWLHSVVV